MNMFAGVAPMGSALRGLIVAVALAGPAEAQAAKPAGGAAGTLGNIGSSREPISIDADRLDVFDKEGRAVFTGNVVAVQGETNMRCSEMNVFYESKTGPKAEQKTAAAAGAPAASPAVSPAAVPAASSAASPPGGIGQDSAIKKILCKGPVLIKTKTQTATGDRAEFDRVVNKVFLIGNATLNDGPNVAKGERVAYDLNTGVARIEGGRVRTLIVPGADKDKPKGR